MSYIAPHPLSLSLTQTHIHIYTPLHTHTHHRPPLTHTSPPSTPSLRIFLPFFFRVQKEAYEKDLLKELSQAVFLSLENPLTLPDRLSRLQVSRFSCLLLFSVFIYFVLSLFVYVNLFIGKNVYVLFFTFFSQFIFLFCFVFFSLNF